ncbi:MAG: ArsR/SmtB family transcription factor [Haloferacaceae archaeon]
MTDTTRLRRLLADELGECCDGDVADRLASLERLEGAVPDDPTPDLRALKTLGDGTRYRIVRLLVAADGDLCVCELTPLLDVSESAISHALADLTEAGLVARRKAGTWRYYRPTDRAERLVETLDATREAPA